MNAVDTSITDYLSKKELSALLDISRTLNSSLDFNEILNHALERLTEILHAEASSIWLVDESSRQLYVASATGEKSNAIRKVRLNIGEGIVGQVVSEGKSRLIADARGEPAHARNIAQQVGFEAKSLLCVPMRSKDKVIGAIEALNKTNGRLFNPKDERHISLFANLAGIAIQNAKIYDLSQQENINLRRELGGKKTVGFDDIIGESPKLEEVKKIAQRVAEIDSNLLLRGESGTGKGMLAEAIHRVSQRSNGPFIKVLCGAIPETLLESELFGYEKGAFTGAVATKPGRFELANNGTIFLDEVGDTPLPLQAKLLHAIEHKEIDRVGGTKTLKVNVRVIAATNLNLEQKMKEGKFREDLYYRLDVININIPPLRERKEDIALLAENFLAKCNLEMNKKIKGFSQKAMNILINYDWPGNVRELENAVERACVMTDSDFIQPNDLSLVISKYDDEKYDDYGSTLEEAIKGFKKRFLTKTLQHVNGSRTKAAEQLKIQRTYLSRLIKELGINI